MEIREEDLSGEAILALLREHHAEMAAVTPPGSVYALPADGLGAPDITVWSVREDGAVVACGALRRLGASAGEIKSLHTARAHRGRGVASALLEHILEVGRQRGYRRIRLETGGTEAFASARRFYRRHGFVPGVRFGNYPDDPHSAFLVLELSGRT